MPGSGDDVLFEDTYLVNPIRTVDLNGNRSIESLNIYGNGTTNTFSDYTLDTTVGANTLTLGNGVNGNGYSIDSRYGNHVINCNLFLNNTNAGNQSASTVRYGTLTINGVISGGNGLVLGGDGTMILTNANTYSGGTALRQGGTLRVANSTGSATGTGGVIVTNGGTLEGTGQMHGAITIGPNATISPGNPSGNSIGTLTALSSLTVSGTYPCELNQSNSDRVAVTGILNISGATLDLTELAQPEAATYTIATCGSLQSIFAHVKGLSARYSIQYASTAITVVRNSNKPVWHVTPDATSADTNGASWASPANLQYALATAVPGDEIWVKAGVYYPDEGTGQTNNDRAATFQVPLGVALLGGFAGTETNADQRDPYANPTVLSGDIDQNDPSTNGVILTGNDAGASNAYTVVTISVPANTSLGSETRLDGFTITGGRADVKPINVYPQSFGGGVYVSVGSSADVPVVENCRLIGNDAISGGGLFTDSGSDCNLVADTFRGNEASSGGGAYYWSGHVNATNCLFAGNYAGNNGGGVLNSKCTLSFVNATFSGNVAATNGGAVFNQLFGKPVTFGNTIIWNNSENGSTTSGAASVANTTSTTFSHCLIQNFGSASGTGNLDGTVSSNDPLFVTPITIGAAPTSDGNLHLQPGSPVIDAGDQSLNVQSTDLDGLARVVGSNIDLGAYEFQTFPLSIAPGGNSDTALVTWPGSAALPLQLEATADLANGPWVTVTNMSVFDINSHTWTSTIGMTPGQAQEFFRLTQ